MHYIIRPDVSGRHRAVGRFAIMAAVASMSLSDASAQDLYGEGPFAVNFVGLSEPDIPPIPTSETAEFGIFNSTMTAINAAGEGLLHNVGGRCLGWWRVDVSAGTLEEEVQCTYIDADGDRIFERAKFDEQLPEGPRIGTGHWTGGTGKYRELKHFE